jgi:hypothetical protein
MTLAITLRLAAEDASIPKLKQCTDRPVVS